MLWADLKPSQISRLGLKIVLKRFCKKTEETELCSKAVYLAVFILTFLVILIRSLDAFLHPIAGWEDATQGINFYVHARSGIFHSYAGYTSVLPNIIDFLAVTLLPLAWVPYVQAWFALVMAATITPATLGFFRHVLQWPIRIAAPTALCIGCLPLGDVATVSNTEFSIWAMLAALLLSLGNPVPCRLVAAAWYILWRLLFTTSIPLSVIALPAWLALAFIHRQHARSAASYLLLAGGALLYAAWGTTHVSILTLTNSQITSIFVATLRLATEKSLLAVTIRGILGINLHASPIWGLTGSFGAATFFLISTHITGRVDRQRAFVEVAGPIAGVVAISFLCMLGRGTVDSNFVLSSPRYLYIPKLLWIVAIAIAVVDVWRWQGRSMWRKPVLVGILSACIVLLWQKGVKNYRSHDAAQSLDIEAFLTDADAKVAQSGGHTLRFPRVASDGDWSIVIDRGTMPSRL